MKYVFCVEIVKNGVTTLDSIWETEEAARAYIKEMKPLDSTNLEWSFLFWGEKDIPYVINIVANQLKQ